MNRKTQSRPPATGRYQAVDVLRGIAIVLMIAYHFSFDLNYFGIIRQNMYDDPFWIGSRTVILSLFLLAMGISLFLAAGGGLNGRRYWRRLGLIAGSALLVTVASRMLFPNSWIFFGVLHFIALASLLGIPFVRLKWTNLLLGAGLLSFGSLYANPFFDQPVWQWFGLMTHKPITEDYVPLLPWFGLVLIGLFLGRVIYGEGKGAGLARSASRTPLARLLAWGGRHALPIYLAHQPLLLGLLGLLGAGSWISGR